MCDVTFFLFFLRTDPIRSANSQDGERADQRHKCDYLEQPRAEQYFFSIGTNGTNRYEADFRFGILRRGAVALAVRDMVR